MISLNPPSTKKFCEFLSKHRSPVFEVSKLSAPVSRLFVAVSHLAKNLFLARLTSTRFWPLRTSSLPMCAPLIPKFVVRTSEPAKCAVVRSAIDVSCFHFVEIFEHLRRLSMPVFSLLVVLCATPQLSKSRNPFKEVFGRRPKSSRLRRNVTGTLRVPSGAAAKTRSGDGCDAEGNLKRRCRSAGDGTRTVPVTLALLLAERPPCPASLAPRRQDATNKLAKQPSTGRKL